MAGYYTINNIGEIVYVSEVNAPSNAKYSVFYIQEKLLSSSNIANVKIIRRYFNVVNLAFDREDKQYFNTNDVLINYLQFLFKVVLVSLIRDDVLKVMIKENKKDKK